MYLGNMLLKDSAPTIRDVVETINDKNEGILIGMDDNGIQPVCGIKRQLPIKRKKAASITIYIGWKRNEGGYV